MQIIANPERYAAKEKMYLSVREAESRIVPDELLRQLPYVAENNPYHNEWQIRAQNLERLVNYLQRRSKGTRLSILDIGCGNGWMSHKLYDAGFKVTGIDLNLSELEQAERVFGTSDALNWVYADILEFNPPELYDIIIFGASCQYFPDIAQLTDRLLPFLKKGGEIHLFDSMFYRATEIQEAKKRSDNYYANLGFPEMSRYYFHHSTEELKKAGYRKLTPRSFFSKKSLEWWALKQ